MTGHPSRQAPAPTAGPKAAAAAAAPVEVAFLSFTEITDPARHRDYNEWHQLDHLPEQYTLPGVRWGQRWVRTPECRAVSQPAGGPLDAADYLTCYLMTPPVEPVLRQFTDLGADLRRRDRFFDDRRAHLSGPFSVTAASASQRVRVAAASVPFRPNLGVFVVLWEEPPGSAGLGAAPAGDLLGLDGVAGVWDLVAHPAGAALGYKTRAQVARLCYLDAPPTSAVPAVAEVLAAHSEALGAEPAFAGPFETITPWHWDWFDRQASTQG